MSTPINVAIIGAGIGREHLQAYLKLADLFRVCCICDIDTARASEIIEQTGADPDVTAVESSFENVLGNDGIDLIDICLPPHLHFSMTKAALEADKHVICEKPLASSLREADDLIESAKSKNRHVFPVFQYRYGPAIFKLQQLVENGFTGKPLLASIETHWNREADYYANPWRGTWKGEQGGAVLGHAIHNHDLLCAIMGPVRRLSGFGATRVNPIETEDCAAISFELENGALATSSITLGAHTDTTRLRFCFENLTAESDLLPYSPAEGNWTFKVRGSTMSQEEVDEFLNGLPVRRSGFAGFFETVADKLNHDKSGVVTLQDGRRSIELVTAIYSAFSTGMQVELPLDAKHPMYDGWLPSEGETT